MQQSRCKAAAAQPSERQQRTMEIMQHSDFTVVYNMLSLGIASMLFTSIFLWIARDRVLPKYRLAVMVSATVTSIAAYHYFRMFDSFKGSYETMTTNAAFDHYNVGYRYVDWFLTVPLLLVELVAVMGLARSVQSSLLKRLVPAAALMIALGYPGDMKVPGLDPGIWGALSTIPFLYILYVLFVEISKSLKDQSPKVRTILSRARLLLIASWGVYPITFILAMGTAIPSASQVVAREVGYSIADIIAKCVFGLMIFTVARIKSAEESKEFAAAEGH
jgi:bacteriorhodopsin